MSRGWKRGRAVILGCALCAACGGSHGAAPARPTPTDAAREEAPGRADTSSAEAAPPIAPAGADPATDAPAAPADARDAAPATSPPDAPREAGADAGAPDAPALPARVLLYHYSTLVIDSVPAQLAFFEHLLAGWGYASDDSVDPAAFTDEGLAAYGAVAMINTCFFPFGDGKDGAKEAAALQRFVARGGGLFGTHCAAVTFQSVSPPPLYNQLFGGQEGDGFFDGTSACRKVGSHPTIDALPATFAFTGNLDNNQVLFPSATVTVRCKWSGGEQRDVAVSWVRAEGAGRIFYTNLGKVAADLTDPVLGGAHIVPGLAWVLRR